MTVFPLFQSESDPIILWIFCLHELIQGFLKATVQTFDILLRIEALHIADKTVRFPVILVDHERQLPGRRRIGNGTCYKMRAQSSDIYIAQYIPGLIHKTSFHPKDLFR